MVNWSSEYDNISRRIKWISSKLEVVDSSSNQLTMSIFQHIQWNIIGETFRCLCCRNLLPIYGGVMLHKMVMYKKFQKQLELS